MKEFSFSWCVLEASNYCSSQFKFLILILVLGFKVHIGHFGFIVLIFNLKIVRLQNELVVVYLLGWLWWHTNLFIFDLRLRLSNLLMGYEIYWSWFTSPHPHRNLIILILCCIYSPCFLFKPPSFSGSLIYWTTNKFLQEMYYF